MIQVEAGVQIIDNKQVVVKQVVSSQGDIPSSQLKQQINQIQAESTQDTSEGSTVSGNIFGTDEDRN